MIEQAIYFGLGCVVAGLMALGFLPVMWSRAQRLMKQRLQSQIPVSMQEILADRDHLRAEFAVERRKLEQAMERVAAEKATDMSELGRRAVEAFTLAQRLEAAQAERAAQDVHIVGLLRKEEEAQAQTGALQIALHDTHVYFERQLTEFQTLRRSFDELEALAEVRRTTIAGLQTRTMGLEMTIEDGARTRATLERQVESLQQTIQRLDEERSASPSTGVAWHGAADGAAPLDQAVTRIQQLETSLQAAVQDAKEREKSIHLQRSLQAERARGDNRAGLEKLEALQVENAALHGALDAARQGSTNGATSPADDAAQAKLRASIHEIGLAVARLMAAEALNAADHERRPSAIKPLPRPEPAGVNAPSLT